MDLFLGAETNIGVWVSLWCTKVGGGGIQKDLLSAMECIVVHY